MNLEIIICGQGNMAKALFAACEAGSVVSHRFNPEMPRGLNNSVAVHFGSGREFPALLEYCEDTKTPLIQGSTSVEMPTASRTVVINAPNLSLPMVRFISAFPSFLEAVRSGMDVGIAESHQCRKRDVSGTARAIANSVGIEEAAIMVIRDQRVQRALGVPQEYLDGHAYHIFDLDGQGVEIQVTTKIHGRGTYAEGALLLAKALLANAGFEPEVGVHHLPLVPGVHSLNDRKTQRVFSLLED